MSAAVQVGAIDMAYTEQGRGERAFVLVHGFTGSSDDFLDVHASLAEAGRTVLVDQRGHGDSSNVGDPDGYSFDIQVADLLGFLDTLGIASCDLLGHSMGGMVALRFALAHPDRLSSLVLMDTSCAPITMMPVAMMQAGARIGREQGMGVLFETMRVGAANDQNRAPASLRCEQEMGPERYWERIRAKIEAMDPEAMHALAAELADHDAVTERLAEIACPTLVIVGEQDKPFLEPSQTMADQIPDARLVKISDAAHSPQHENRGAWLEAVHAHLERARA
jgi:pimeloyl-ACP methyl ester carboxylesterase